MNSSSSPGHDAVDLVERQVDAVVATRGPAGNCRCGCARCGRRCRPGHLRSAARVACSCGTLLLIEPRAQDLHRLGAVLVLALLLLHRNHDAGRQMRDAHRAFGLVDVLAAGAGGAVDVDAQIALVDLDVDLLGLRQHRDGDGGGVDAALALGRRHALHAVHAGFVFQPGEHAAAGDLGDAFLQAAQLGVVVFQDLEAPAAQLRVALVHARTARRRTAPPRRRRRPGAPPGWRSARRPRPSAAGRGGSRARSGGMRSFRSAQLGFGQFVQFGIGEQRFGLGAARARRRAVRRCARRAGSSSASSFDAWT